MHPAGNAGQKPGAQEEGGEQAGEQQAEPPGALIGRVHEYI